MTKHKSEIKLRGGRQQAPIIARRTGEIIIHPSQQRFAIILPPVINLKTRLPRYGLNTVLPAAQARVGCGRPTSPQPTPHVLRVGTVTVRWHRFLLLVVRVAVRMAVPRWQFAWI